MVSKIEKHDFEPLQALAWRNSDLDFSGVDALLDSLSAPPPMPGLSKGHDATDHITLSMLAREDEVRRLAGGSRSRVRLLWEACQVPDFRKLADDSHAALCGRIFRHLAEDGVLPDEWVAGHIAQLGNVEGDLDTLMARLASIRVWSYVAARADWLRDAVRFQNEARAAEDAVSDALHERLTARFVDRRAAHLIRRLDDTEEELLSAVTRQGEVVVEGHGVGRVSGFLFQPEAEGATEEERRLVLRAARRALREEMPRRVAALETAADDAFGLTQDHRVTWTAAGGEPAEVARLRPGPEPSKPAVEVLPSEFLDGAQRERVRARLAKWVEGLVGRELGAIAAVETKAEADGTLRGPAFLLREHLGIAPGATEREIPPDVRQKLKGIGIRAGRFALFIPEALKPRAMALRAQIWALIRDVPVPTLPPPGLVALPMRPVADGEVPPPHALWPSGFAEAMGWLPAGPVLLRLDVAERIAAELGFLTRRTPAPPPPDLASRLGVKGDMLGTALAALGFRLLDPVPLEEGQYGPPTPLRLAQPRPFQGPRREGRGGGGAPQHRQGARPPQQDRQRQQRPPQNGAAEFYGPPVPPELRAAARPPRPPRPEGDGPRHRDQHRGGGGGGGGKPQHAGKPWQGGPPRGGQRPDHRPPRGAAGGGGPPPKPPEKRINPDSPFAILANLKLR
jgi:ATP-dependent RNA helicase SUPV3L1/SUV3